MIKANELRLGNLVYSEKDKCNVNVGVGDFLYKENEYFQPIQLTEEWLIKFGFEKYSTESEFYCLDSTSIYEGTLNYNYKKNFISLSGMNNYYPEELMLVKPMLYVHQLQNLYFALTNEELEIK